MKIKNVLLTFLFFFVFFANSFLAQAQEARTPDFVEYEKITLRPLTDFENLFYPSVRLLALYQVSSYEDFVRRYPNSPLIPNVKLNIAKLYKDVESAEADMWRGELRSCVLNSRGKSWEAEACEAKFRLQIYVYAKPWHDLSYWDLSKKIFLALVKNHGHEKIYAILLPKIGGFGFVDEDIGGEALFWLSQTVDQKDRKEIYELMLREYKVNRDIREEAEEFLKTR